MNKKVYASKEEFLSQRKILGTHLPYSDDVSALKKGIRVGNKVISNRILYQPMEGCDGTADGCPNELTKRRYKRFTKGGAGVVWFEATAVMKDGRANPRQLFIDEYTIDSFKQIVEDIKSEGYRKNGFEPIVIMQATHSGRYSKPNGKPEPLIAYNNPIFEGENPISKDRIVSDEYLDKVRESLVNGAALAEKAGFDGVDIKCCHRYLNSELLSAYNRDGRYGGSLENRTRLLRESIKGAREVCKSDFIVTSRLNLYDGFEYPYGFGIKKGTGEFDMTEPIWLVKKLNEYGVNLINISMGNPYFNPHINRPYAMGAYVPNEHPLKGVERLLKGAEIIKDKIPDIAVVCSGLSYLGVVSPNVASAYIQSGKFDMAGFGRLSIAYPELANDILKLNRLDNKKCCICCSKCTQIMRSGGTPGCVIRDGETYLPIYRELCGGKK